MTFSREVRNASAGSFQESRRAQRVRIILYALVRVRLPSPQGPDRPRQRGNGAIDAPHGGKQEDQKLQKGMNSKRRSAP